MKVVIGITGASGSVFGIDFAKRFSAEKYLICSKWGKSVMAQEAGETLEKRLPRFAYFPFGGGPRICIGHSFAMMEARLVLATIAQRYRLQLPLGHQVEPNPATTLGCKGSVPMQVTAR